MNGNSVVVEATAINFSNHPAEIEPLERQIFEEIQIETIGVSEIETKDAGTRFARLKKVLRKRSSASIL